jgi:hypothetical protein
MTLRNKVGEMSRPSWNGTVVPPRHQLNLLKQYKITKSPKFVIEFHWLNPSINNLTPRVFLLYYRHLKSANVPDINRLPHQVVKHQGLTRLFNKNAMPPILNPLGSPVAIRLTPQPWSTVNSVDLLQNCLCGMKESFRFYVFLVFFAIANSNITV